MLGFIVTYYRTTAAEGREARHCARGDFARAVEIAGDTLRFLRVDGVNGKDLGWREVPMVNVGGIRVVEG